MRTPKEYTANIKNGIITAPMLTDCLYSVNKRATDITFTTIWAAIIRSILRSARKQQKVQVWK